MGTINARTAAAILDKMPAIIAALPPLSVEREWMQWICDHFRTVATQDVEVLLPVGVADRSGLGDDGSFVAEPASDRKPYQLVGWDRGEVVL